MVFKAALPKAEMLWLVFLPSNYDELRGRGAHSCGAVAEFHRLPVHPGDCGYGSRCSLKEQPELLAIFLLHRPL